MNSSTPRKILIVRTDRIGDVVLSLPMVSSLKTCFPHVQLTFLSRSYTQELVQFQEGVDHLLLYDEHDVLKPISAMLAEIRPAKFDAVVVAYPTFRLALLMFLSRIPVRVGTGYRWYSFLFTSRVYEHRKTGEKHEAEYNLSLLKPLGCTPTKKPMPQIAVSSAESHEADRILGGLFPVGTGSFVILHPGSGGSARDWSVENFANLAKALTAAGRRVLVTGATGETELVTRVIRGSEDRAVSLTFVTSLRVLAAIIKKADVFVSNSTGPLHIAAAVGVPVVAFYPPLRPCSAKRWGPLTERKIIFEPSSTSCPRCRGGQCQGNECLDLVSVEQVVTAIGQLHRAAQPVELHE